MVGWGGMRGRNFSNIEAIKKAWRGTKEMGHIHLKMCETGHNAVGSNVEKKTKNYLSGGIINMRMDDHLRDSFQFTQVLLKWR